MSITGLHCHTTPNQHKELLLHKLSVRNILASCPVDPKRSKLSLPLSVTTQQPEVFIDASMEGESFLEDGTYSNLLDDFSLLSPILYSIFANEDYEIMLSPLPTAHTRKPMNARASGGDKQNLYANNNYQHRKNYSHGDSNEFTNPRNSRRFVGSRNPNGGTFHQSKGSGDSYHHHHHNNSHSNSYHHNQYDTERNHSPKSKCIFFNY